MTLGFAAPGRRLDRSATSRWPCYRLSQRDHWRRKHNLGFTLIELLIVLAIAAILALIAYPMYTSYVRNAQRSDARSALLETAQRMERYYASHNHYPDPSNDSSFANITSDEGYWTVGVNTGSNQQSYTLTATKTAKGVSDSTCSGQMTLDQAGHRSPAACW